MKRAHDRRPKPAAVAEPVQVYLERADRDRLARLVSQLDTTKSDVLRRGLEALESLTRRPAKQGPAPTSLPVFQGRGLQAGVDLDDSAGLLDLMQGDDAAR